MREVLIAYIPVFNRKHMEWFFRHPNSNFGLISQHLAETLVPRLARNIGALPNSIMVEFVKTFCIRVVMINPPRDFMMDDSCSYIMPDEDVSRAFAKKHIVPGVPVVFEPIWARHDMLAVKKREPVIPDCEVSSQEVDLFRMAKADKIAEKSPDWWRQIGIIAFRGETILGVGANHHFPTEYEQDMFGDPRINFDAGDPDGLEIYLSLHAEEYLAGFCARKGISLEGASVYINTFPCGRCARMLATTGIKELFFREGSSFLKGFEILKNAGIRIVQVKDSESAK